MKMFLNHRSRSPVILLGGLLIILFLISPLSLAVAAPPPQTEITTQSVIDALSAWFATYSGFEFAQRGWITIGDLGKARARLDQWDVEAYIDADYLNETGANAAYVDYTNAGLGYFNDLVFANQPANVAGVTVWHEVMHAIFDANDSDLKVTNDEIYTWYMEGQIRGLGHLMGFENELRSPDCDPEELERNWNRFNVFMTKTAIDFGGYGAITVEGKAQLAQLTGFQVPDPATLRGLYETSGLLEKCKGTPTPGPTETQAPPPTAVATKDTVNQGNATSSRMFLIDNSGSMDGMRIAAAISSAQSTLSGLSPKTEVAVQFFGTFGCDVSIVQDFTLDHGTASQVIASATAWGDTPLAAAIAQGGAYMRTNASTNNMVMILLSDGEETCEGDPVDAAGQLNSTSSSMPGKISSLGGVVKLAFSRLVLAQSSGTITLHVVGFGIEPGSETEAQLQAVAAAGLGNYYQADDEIELTEALQEAAEDSPRGGLFSGNWILICGGSLVCLLGLGLGIAGIVFLTRRSKKAAEVIETDPPAPVVSPESKTSPPDAPPNKTTKKQPEKKTPPAVCDSCGEPLQPDENVCSHCGAPQGGEKQ
ncbi:MAG: VWA domain-containing protein [Anaerolineales bacterium]